MSAWESLVASAVQGTARRAPAREDWLVDLPDTLALGGEATEQILDAAALATLARRSGFKTIEASPFYDVAVPPDPRPQIPAELLYEFTQGTWLSFLLTAADERGMRLPSTFVPAIFDRASAWPVLARPALRLAGELGSFLLPLNPAWRSLAERAVQRDAGGPRAGDAQAGDQPGTPLDDSAWHLGTTAEQRVAWLVGLRRRDRSAALPYLQAALAGKGEPVAIKEALLRGLDGWLSDEEAQLLETCLDAKLARVRAAAAIALRRAPLGSAFTERMIARQHTWLTWATARDGRKVLDTRNFPLTERDKRDGFTDLDDQARYQQLGSAVPLASWAAFAPVAELVAAAPNRALLAGWVERVLFEQDESWVRPLLATGCCSELVSLLSAAEAEEYVESLLDLASSGGPTANVALAELDRLDVLPLTARTRTALVRALPGLARGATLPSGVVRTVEQLSQHAEPELLAQLQQVLPMLPGRAQLSVRGVLVQLERGLVEAQTRQRLLDTLDRACRPPEPAATSTATDATTDTAQEADQPPTQPEGDRP